MSFSIIESNLKVIVSDSCQEMMMKSNFDRGRLKNDLISQWFDSMNCCIISDEILINLPDCSNYSRIKAWHYVDEVAKPLLPYLRRLPNPDFKQKKARPHMTTDNFVPLGSFPSRPAHMTSQIFRPFALKMCEVRKRRRINLPNPL